MQCLASNTIILLVYEFLSGVKHYVTMSIVFLYEMRNENH